jgi:hypothetical protein
VPKAIGVVAHHDDHVLWMGGTIQRLAGAGWQWTLIAMCVPDPNRRAYFDHCCSIFGAVPVAMGFQDYMEGAPFGRNNRDQMRNCLTEAVHGQSFDLVFTHCRGQHGEYGGRHANHVEVLRLTDESVNDGQLGRGRASLAYFAYDIIYGGGTATGAKTDAEYVLPLTYPELLWKCQLCSLAPDADTNLRGLAFPCPNPEGFEGDGLILPGPFVCRG